MEASVLTRIDSLIRREVVPATGCTEPACVALCVAYAASTIPEGRIAQIIVRLSPNMVKNAMAVGIPGTGMIGIPIAIALGAVIRKPSQGLQVLEGFDEETLRRAKELEASGMITVELCDEPGVDKLYVETYIHGDEGQCAHSIIDRTHTGLRLLELDGRPVMVTEAQDQPLGAGAQCGEVLTGHTPQHEDIALTYDLVYDYATTAPIELLEFVYDAALVNKAVAEHALSSSYGHNTGRIVQSPRGVSMMGDGPLARMIAYTSGACDARMGGAPLTVMSNSGSGNQGITATLSVLTFAESQRASREQTIRALMLSSLMVVYIKQHLGRLSGLCGMIVSGIGLAAAMVYLMGGCRRLSGYAIKNVVGSITGMICDGAKPSCSLKASTAISSAAISAMLAMEQEHCTSIEGIVADDVDTCIRNLATIGSEGMAETDRKVLEVMMSKAR